MPVPKTYRVHFVGIGGIGMSGIAEVLLNLGYVVTGSDQKDSEVTRRLASLGASVYLGHQEKHLQDADVVVVSSAVAQDNPEVRAAVVRRIPVIQRAEMLAELMRMKYGVAIAGSHGKTTTTSMLAWVLAQVGLDPTVVVGGRLNALGSNACLGQGDYLVAEADESDGSFLKLSPTYAVITNIDPEHLDHYGDIDTLVCSFVDFANKVPFYGLVAVCVDNPVVQSILPRLGKRFVSYGFDPQADYCVVNLEFGPGEISFDVRGPQQAYGRICLPMVGEYNALNALATVAICDELLIPFEKVQKALQSFSGVDRRFSIRGEVNDILVVDDYAHHPTEIRATLAGAARSYPRRLVVVFQPHRYSRARDLQREFFAAFDRADALVVMDIYAAGEQPIDGVSAAALYRGIRNHGPQQSHYIAEHEQVVQWLLSHCHPGDLLITMGAGDVWRVAQDFLSRAHSGGRVEK